MLGNNDHLLIGKLRQSHQEYHVENIFTFVANPRLCSSFSMHASREALADISPGLATAVQCTLRFFRIFSEKRYYADAVFLKILFRRCTAIRF